MDISTITALTRQREGLSQQKMGDALGVTHQAISQWESGISTPEAILLVCIAMKCNGWRRDWAWACIEAHPRYISYDCNGSSSDPDEPPAGVA